MSIAAQLSVRDAAAYYDEAVAELHPGRVILHLGAGDAAWCSAEPAAFDEAFRALLRSIRASTRECRIGIITQRNSQNDPQIAALNRRLVLLAQSEQCEVEDISVVRVWNPEGLMQAMQFVSAMGAGSRRGKSLYDLAKILFCSGTDAV